MIPEGNFPRIQLCIAIHIGVLNYIGKYTYICIMRSQLNSKVSNSMLLVPLKILHYSLFVLKSSDVGLVLFIFINALGLTLLCSIIIAPYSMDISFLASS